ncbi:hypothetical protein GGH91_005579, partial [Coemansia sp. RSA 2671]
MFTALASSRRLAQPLVLRSVRAFTASAIAKQDAFVPKSLHTLSEDEEMMKDAVSRFAREVVQPRVSSMDEAETMEPSVIRGLFDAGLMGVETPVELGGAGASFTSAIVVVEELAKIDPSVSVLCDVHNTLVNTVFRTYASSFLQEKYLPALSTSALGCFCL